MIATLGGGCFWCIEAALRDIKGVLKVTSGYMGGETDNPSYEQVCSGTTGHAEVVQVECNEKLLPFNDLLLIFFSLHNPTTLNRQGGDVGTQYRSVIFTEPGQDRIAHAVIDEVQQYYDAPIVTEVTPASTFWPAEDYHQRYFQKNPDNAYCAAVVAPKVAKLRRTWAHRLKEAQ